MKIEIKYMGKDPVSQKEFWALDAIDGDERVPVMKQVKGLTWVRVGSGSLKGAEKIKADILKRLKEKDEDLDNI